MIIFISLHQKTVCKTNNDGLGLSGTSSCCENSTEANQKWPWKCWQVLKLGSINMIRKPRRNQRFGWQVPSPQNSKDHPAHKGKWLPVSLENQAMSPPFLLRTDWQSLQTGTHITVSWRSLKFGASTIQRRESVAFFFNVTMTVCTQQQQQLTFSMKARYSCCHTNCIRQTSLPATSSYSQMWRNSWRVPYLRVLKMHVECSWGLLKINPNQPGLRSGTSGFTTWQSAYEGRLKKILKNGVILCLVSPISNEYLETSEASLRIHGYLSWISILQ